MSENDVRVKKIDQDRYIIACQTESEIRCALYRGKIHFCVADVAECIGYKSRAKMPHFPFAYTIKIQTEWKSGYKNGLCMMNYISAEDAVDWVSARAEGTAFKTWFVDYAVQKAKELEPNASAAAEKIIVCDEHEEPEAFPKLEPHESSLLTGESLQVSSCIDRIIVELLTLKMHFK